MVQFKELSKDFKRQFYSRSILFAKYAIRDMPRDIDVLTVFEGAKVSIGGSKKLLETPNGQHMAIMSLNLLSRFCSNIDILISSEIETVIDFPMAREKYLVLNLQKLCNLINPFVKVGLKVESNKRYDASIVIGSSGVKAIRTISINSDGWISYVNTEGDDLFSVSSNQNPIGAQLAACFGVAEIFKALFSRIPGCNPLDVAPIGTFVFSSFDYGLKQGSIINPSLPGSVPLETVYFISVGAINSAAAYALRSIPGISGRLVAFESQTLEISNLGRYLLATVNDVILEKSKVELLKSFFSPPFQVLTFHYDYHSGKQRHPIDLAVLGVDRNESRWAVQEDFPRLILCGGTELSFVRVSRHDDFLNKACVGCLYPKLQREGSSSSSETAPVPTISFVSALAGIFLGAEIIKERINGFQEGRLDTMLHLNALRARFFRITRPPKSPRCGCNCQHPHIMESYKLRHHKVG